MIKYLQFKNQYNYTVLQLKIDYENKTYRIGQFKILSKQDTVTRKSFFEKIEELKMLGFNGGY
jgi:hypothetical protein